MSSIDDLARLLANNKKPRAGQTSIKMGIISGDTISFEGKTYPYDVAVDIPISDGDWVYAILNTRKTLAVVVGR